MIFEHNLIISLVIIVSVIEDIHLLETFLMSLHLFNRAVFKDVTFDLFSTILAQIVDLITVLKDFLSLKFIKNIVKIFYCILGT
jgi:hypothetical protein